MWVNQMKDLTAFQRDMLWTINGLGSPKGLSIKKELEAYYELEDDEEINHGRLYPNLDDLVEEGLVEKSERDLRTNDYELTEKARRALQARAAWEDEQMSSEVEA